MIFVADCSFLSWKKFKKTYLNSINRLWHVVTFECVKLPFLENAAQRTCKLILEKQAATPTQFKGCTTTCISPIIWARLKFLISQGCRPLQTSSYIFQDEGPFTWSQVSGYNRRLEIAKEIHYMWFHCLALASAVWCGEPLPETAKFLLPKNSNPLDFVKQTRGKMITQ